MFPNWESLNRFAWIQELRDCPQDPIYHAEGDVWIHTKMVMEALMDMAYWPQLEEESQKALFWSAVMHDIAKPMCTQTEHQ